MILRTRNDRYKHLYGILDSLQPQFPADLGAFFRIGAHKPKTGWQPVIIKPDFRCVNSTGITNAPCPTSGTARPDFA
jgi:hypothetical protein